MYYRVAVQFPVSCMRDVLSAIEREGERKEFFVCRSFSHETQINAIIHEVSQRKQTHLREKSIPGKIYWKIIREFQKETRRKRQSHPRNLLQSGTRTPWICCWNLAIPDRKASILAAGKRAKESGRTGEESNYESGKSNRRETRK